jgi:hypothetical protein
VIRDFQATCQEPFHSVIPPENTRPVRVCSADESRGGVVTVPRRRLTACGVQPVGTVQHVFAWFDGDGAVAPTTGERCCLEVSSLNAETCQRFVEAVAETCPASLNSLLRENRGAHTAQQLRWPANVRCVWLPP